MPEPEQNLSQRASQEQEQEVPPPLPHPNLADVMAVLTQLMQMITHFLA
jgi:hypothetical protein